MADELVAYFTLEQAAQHRFTVRDAGMNGELGCQVEDAACLCVKPVREPDEGDPHGTVREREEPADGAGADGA